MAEEEMSDDEFFEEMKRSLEETINAMQAQMGRFPTEDEVIRFVWGTDADRDEILKKGSIGGA